MRILPNYSHLGLKPFPLCPLGFIQLWWKNSTLKCTFPLVGSNVSLSHLHLLYLSLPSDSLGQGSFRMSSMFSLFVGSTWHHLTCSSTCHVVCVGRSDLIPLLGCKSYSVTPALWTSVRHFLTLPRYKHKAVCLLQSSFVKRTGLITQNSLNSSKHWRLMVASLSSDVNPLEKFRAG